MSAKSDAERVAQLEAAAELLAARLEALETMATEYADLVLKMSTTVADLAVACKQMATEVVKLRTRSLRSVK